MSSDAEEGKCRNAKGSSQNAPWCKSNDQHATRARAHESRCERTRTRHICNDGLGGHSHAQREGQYTMWNGRGGPIEGHANEGGCKKPCNKKAIIVGHEHLLRRGLHSKDRSTRRPDCTEEGPVGLGDTSHICQQRSPRHIRKRLQQ